MQTIALAVADVVYDDDDNSNNNNNNIIGWAHAYRVRVRNAAVSDF